MGDWWSGFLDQIQVVCKHQHPELLSEGNFTLSTMYEQFKSILKMSPAGQVFSMQQEFSAELMANGREKEIQEKIKGYKSMMDSMTKEELDNPKLIKESRMMRIARGSGHEIGEVMEMLEEYKRLAEISSRNE